MTQQPIKLIVGLGNPGADYEATRHNAGSWFVEKLADHGHQTFRQDNRHHGQICRLDLPGGECWLLKPTTYMNHSGRSVASLAGYFRIAPQEILVAHDELDLPPGDVRLKCGGGHGGHNGLRDIMNALGSRDFLRLRIGIDHPGQQAEVVNYVLGRPSQGDRQAILEAVERAIDCLDDLLPGRLQKVMNRLHTRREHRSPG